MNLQKCLKPHLQLIGEVLVLLFLKIRRFCITKYSNIGLGLSLGLGLAIYRIIYKLKIDLTYFETLFRFVSKLCFVLR